MASPVLTANSPSSGYIAWTAFHIVYNGVDYSIASGSTNLKFTWWLYNAGAGGALQSSNTLPTLSDDDLFLFVNRSGLPINLQYTYLIDGSLVVQGTIIGDSIAAGTIQGTNIAAHTIDASLIVADTLTAGEIAAGAIGTSELFAGSVTAAKIASGVINTTLLTAGFATFLRSPDPLNGLINPGLEYSTSRDYWDQTSGTVAVVVDNTKAHTGNNYLQLTAAASSFAESFAVDENGTAVYYEVDEGDVIYFGGWAYRESGNANGLQMKLLVYDKDKANVATAATTTAVTAAAWTSGTATYTVAAGKKYVRLEAIINNNGTGTTVGRFDDMFLTVQVNGAGIVASSITATQIQAASITGDRLVAGTIQAAQIQSGTITTTQIAAFTILAGNIAAGTITTTQVATDTLLAGNIAAGAIATSELASGAITTAKFAVTAAAPQVDNTNGGAVTPTYGVFIDTTGITINDPGGSAVLTGAGFGGSWISFIESKVYNSNFDSGPTNGNGTTLTTGSAAATTVPKWTLVIVGGTKATVSWRNDATVGRLGQLRFNLAIAGSASDEAYVYQDVPVPPAGVNVMWTHVGVITGNATTVTGSSQFYLKMQYLKADGTTTTGTEGSYVNTAPVGTLDYIKAVPNSGVQPTDAAYLRVKVGIKRNTAGVNQTTQIELYSVEVQKSPRYLIWGTGTEMGALTTGTEASSGSGRIYIAPFTSGAFPGIGSGMWMSGSTVTGGFDIPMTFAQTTVLNGFANTGFLTSSDGLVTLRRDDSQTIAAIQYFSGASANGGILALRKTRAATIGATDVAVALSDEITSIRWQAIDSAGGAYQNAAAIYGMVDSAGTLSAGNMPGMLSFRTANAGVLSEQWTINRVGSLIAADGNNIAFGSTTGTKLGTATTQKMGFWNTPPVTQAALAPTAVVAVTAAGATNTWFRNTTSAGGLGGSAYTFGDLVFALKTVGLIPA